MGRKKEKTINLTELEPEEKLKYEIAEELGLLDRVMQDGWKSLTSIVFVLFFFLVFVCFLTSIYLV